LHPYAPFITEEIWEYFKSDENDILVLSSWPKSDETYINDNIEEEMYFIMTTISSIRNIKSDLNISPKKEAELFCRGANHKTDIILKNKKYFKSFLSIEEIYTGEKIDKPNQSSTTVIQDVEIFLPLAGLIDLSKEIKRLKIKILDLEGRIKSVKSKLDNNSFISKAPKDIVAHEQKKYDNYKSDYDKLVENFNSLSS
jgi:valyl-tRNA synthetase